MTSSKKILDAYNNSQHISIKIVLTDVENRYANTLWTRLYGNKDTDYTPAMPHILLFRISKNKNLFDNVCMLHSSKEHFTVDKVLLFVAEINVAYKKLPITTLIQLKAFSTLKSFNKYPKTNIICSASLNFGKRQMDQQSYL